jgi:Na+/glutamate symporter
MSGWILIFALTGGYGAAVTTQKFVTEKNCQQAGEAAMKMMQGSLFNPRFICMPAG